MKLFITTLFVILGSYASAKELPQSKSWRPVVDSTKCAAALAWSIPTMIGLGLNQAVGAVSDVGAMVLEGKLCFSASRIALSTHRPIMTTLFELGCIAPINDINNPVYYSYIYNSTKTVKAQDGFEMFKCEQ